jgi:hypothetical protein
MVAEIEKMKNVNLMYPIKWEHVIINGDMYFVQGVLPNGKILVSKIMSEKEFKDLFN